MYYNIKIKSNGSEFTLESNNKSVTQREMDIYFAYIFSASEDFKSKIKKIEIVDENVKSIDEIEKAELKSSPEIIEEVKTPSNTEFYPEVKIQSEAPSEKKEDVVLKNEPDSSKVEVIENETIQKPRQEDKLELKTFFKSMQINKQEIPSSEQIPAPSFVIQNEPEIVPSKSTMAPIAQDFTINEDVTKTSDIIKIAQDKIEKTDIFDDDFDKSLMDIFAPTKEPDVSTPQEVKKELKEIPYIQKEDDEVPVQSTIDDIFNDKNEDNSNEHPDVDEALGIIPSDVSFDIKQEAELENEQEIQQQENKVELSSEEKIAQIVQKCSNLDCASFLSALDVEDISDEFLICAFYIKNILRQNGFTMKFINSNLFQASGKIADMSIVDELIQKEYIKSIDVDDIKKYAITDIGEKYFLSNFLS